VFDYGDSCSGDGNPGDLFWLVLPVVLLSLQLVVAVVGSGTGNQLLVLHSVASKRPSQH
jgi:hypothetical protein